jgi:hypothetical protein
VFSGGLAACGPVGDFASKSPALSQANYLGDFRVLFDYFFPSVLPGSPLDIPQELRDNWETVYAPAVLAALQADPAATAQLLSVSGAPVDPADPATVAETVLSILWYNVFATQDAIDTLGGVPFDNRLRLYLGSLDDVALNLGVPRFDADPAALAEAAANYEPSGKLTRPLVTLHTTGDPVVPFWHELLYTAKVVKNRSLTRYFSLPVVRYGHCAFTEIDVLTGFAILVFKVSRQYVRGGQELMAEAGFYPEVYLPALSK